MGTEAPLWQIFEGFLNIWQSFVPTLSKIWAIFIGSKKPNI